MNRKRKNRIKNPFCTLKIEEGKRRVGMGTLSLKLDLLCSISENFYLPSLQDEQFHVYKFDV
jgi:hypothetical protein